MAKPDILLVLTEHDWKSRGDAWNLVKDEKRIHPIYPTKLATRNEDRESQKKELIVVAGTETIKNHPDMVVINSPDPEFGHGLAHVLVDLNSFPAKNIVLVELVLNDYRYRKYARELGTLAVSYKGFLQILAGLDLTEIKTTS